MDFSNRYALFAQDKQSFFKKNMTLKDVEQDAKDKSYQFTAKNRLLIEQEFKHLFAALNVNGAGREEYWLYCYYCCIMLQTHYASYNMQKEVDRYSELAAKLKFKCETGQLPIDKVTFHKSFMKKIADDLYKFATTIYQIDKISEWAGFLNIQRLHTLFCRLTLRESFLLAKELLIVLKFEQYFGFKIDVNRMVDNINAPTPLFNFFSVALFATRFITNSCLIVKHSLVPSENEKKLTMSERFYLEVDARYCTMANDLTWAAVNAVCNLRWFLKLSSPASNWLTAGFLFFDLSLFLYRRELTSQEYLLKKAQYLKEKERAFGEGDLKRLAFVEELLAQLEIENQKSDASFIFSIAAASLLFGSFSASLILATPISAIICYCACTIGVVMYISADKYGAYIGATYSLLQQELVGKNSLAAQDEQRHARNDFFLALAKNAIMPYVFVTIFAISWPLAITAVLLYAAYQSDYFSNLKLVNSDEPPQLTSMQLS